MENEKVKFEFSVNELNIILAGLGELPAKASLPLIQKIQGAAQVSDETNFTEDDEELAN
tara:strand:- start:197 stop:373 length:177 start_codon:yes stop_codon:yes gene_type:complete